MFVLERLFQLLLYAPLLQQLLLALACAAPSSSGGAAAAAREDSDRNGDGRSCRTALLGMLSSARPYKATLVLRMLVSALHNRHLSSELLRALSVLPRRHQTATATHNNTCSVESAPGQLALLVQAALEELQGLSLQAQEQSNSGAASSSAPPHDLLALLSQRYLPGELQAPVDDEGGGATAAAPTAAPTKCSSTGSNAGLQEASRPPDLCSLETWLQHAAADRHGTGHTDSSAGAAFATFGTQLLEVLMALLEAPAGLPPMALRLLAWLLHQLLPPVLPPLAVPPPNSAGGTDGAAIGAPSCAGSNDCQAEPDATTSTTPAPGSMENADDAGDVSSSLPRSRTSCSSTSADGGGAMGDDTGARGSGGGGPSCGASSGSAVTSQSSCRSPSGSGAPETDTSWALGLMQQASGAQLNKVQHNVLQRAVASAGADFKAQLQGMWCDAAFPLLVAEWPLSREALLRPVLRASADALLSGSASWQLLRGLLQHSSSNNNEDLSESGQAALECYAATQRLVALAQMQQV